MLQNSSIMTQSSQIYTISVLCMQTLLVYYKKHVHNMYVQLIRVVGKKIMLLNLRDDTFQMFILKIESYINYYLFKGVSTKQAI